MPNRFLPLGTGADFDQARAVINANFAQLDNEAVNKVFKGPEGIDAVVVGKLPDGRYGLYLTDGTVTTIITASGIEQNDGTNDRIFLGNEA